MDVKILAPEGRIKATEFVQARPDAKFCHLPAWSDLVECGMGHRSAYLVARDNGAIVGVLPLTHVKSRLFGDRLISQGMSNYGGPLTVCPEAASALVARAIEIAQERCCQSIEFRALDVLDSALYNRVDKICMYLSLPGDAEALWKGFDAKVRNQVRKAEKSEIVAESGGIELLGEFYKVYSARMHQLGTPAFSSKLMSTLLAMFPEQCRIFVVRLQSLTVGAGFTWCYNGLAEIPWAGTDIKYNGLCPNNLLYWTIIKHYCQAGAKWFDFGRCTVEGNTYHFKKQWGAEPLQLHYQYWFRPGHEQSIATPDNPKYKKKVEMWKRLPLWVTHLVGPYISRDLP